MIEVIRCDLEPTPTYAARACVWVSLGTGEVEVKDAAGGWGRVPADGKLTVKVQRGHGYGLACELDTYAVSEEPSAYPGVRRFLLLSLTDPGQREPYAVQVGGVDTCRCKAGRCKVADCKHRSAVEAVIAEGGLEETAYRRRLVSGVASVRHGSVAGCVKGVLA